MDKLPLVRLAVKVLTKDEVLVGVPDAKADRRQEQLAAGFKPKMNNAVLAYIHDNGSPAANIPARPFMYPGIMNAKTQIMSWFKKAGVYALEGSLDKVEKCFEAVGLTAQSSIKRKITTGPFVPLAASTIRNRMRKRKSRNNVSIRPLIDTSQMRNAITYVIRKRGA